MRRLSSFALAIFFTCTVFAQANNPPKRERPVGSPWDFTFGPQEDGNFGTTLKGSRYYPLRRLAPTPEALARQSTDNYQLFSPYIGVDIDGAWNSAPDALNNFSFSLKPSIAAQHVYFRRTPGTQLGDESPTTRGPWLFAFLDARQRYGSFKEGDPEEVRQVNQTMLGAGVEVRITPIAAWYRRSAWGRRIGRIDGAPSLSATYYSVERTNSTANEIPEGITLDTIQLKTRAGFTLPFQCEMKESPQEPADDGEADDEDAEEEVDIYGDRPVTQIACPWMFDVSYTASLPLEGDTDMDHLGDVALSYETGGSMKPVIRYRSGEEHGLEYDRQLIIGVLWSLTERK